MRSYYQQLIKQEETLGLDISNASVKAIQLKTGSKSLTLINIAEEEIPISSYVGGVIRQPDVVAEKIKNLLLTNNLNRFTTRKAICSIPDDKVFIQVTKLPFLSESKLQQALELKLSSLLPIPLEDIYWDWTILSENKATKELTISVASVARYTLDSYIQTLKLADIIPIAFEPSQIAALRVIKGEDYKNNNKNWGIIDIEKTTTRISLVVNGVIEYITSVHFGTNQIEKVIGEYYKLKDTEIEEKVKDVGYTLTEEANPTDKVLIDSLNKIIAPLLGSLSSTLTYYSNTFDPNNKTPLEELILLGAGADVKGIKELIFSKSQIEIRLGGNPFKVLPIAQWMEHRKIYPYIPVLGLALAGKSGQPLEISLLPKRLEKSQFLHYIFSKVLFFTKLASINLIAFACVFGIFIGLRYFQNNQLTTRVKATQNILQSGTYSDLSHQVNNLNTQLTIISNAASQQLNWIPVIDSLSKLVPAGAVLGNLSITSSTNNPNSGTGVSASTTEPGPWAVSIQGNASTRAVLLQFQQNLEGSTYFSGVQLPISNLTSSSNIQFTLVATINKVPSL